MFPLGRPGTSILVTPSFRSVVVQKVGSVTAKNSSFDVYNLYMQISIGRRSASGEDFEDMVFALGNLHTGGLGDESTA
jgi:hypothetical protein